MSVPTCESEFSNWNVKAGNSTTSVFLGTTGAATVRFSDDFAGAGQLVGPTEHTVITAITGAHDAVVYQGSQVLAQKGAPLAERNLKTPYVIGRQGTLDAEYWNGDIAELLVFNRDLTGDERNSVWHYLHRRYGMTQPKPDPAHLALASLCHVLLNANEFIYVD